MIFLDRFVITLLFFWSRTYQPTELELLKIAVLALGFTVVWQIGEKNVKNVFQTGKND